MPIPRFALDIDVFARPDRSEALLQAVRTSAVIADGAMGTMLQQHDLSIDTDFHAPPTPRAVAETPCFLRRQHRVSATRRGLGARVGGVKRA